VLEASLIRATRPLDAVALLDPAIALYRERHHAMWLPTAFLERGRAFRAAGNSERALADFESGLTEVEAQRSTIEDERRRAGFFDTTPDLFAEAIVLRLENNDVEGAHRTAERARARTLYERLGATNAIPCTTSLKQLRDGLDPQTVVVAYSLLPDGVAIFAIDRDSVRVVREPVDMGHLRSLTSRLVTSVQNNRLADTQRAGAELWRILIKPVVEEIDARTRVVIVPDRFLHSITYPALFDSRTRQFLVERHEIVIAPSATLAPVDADPKIATSRALVIGDPALTSDVARLPYAAVEARTVASTYGVEPLIGNRATLSEFLARAPESALIHYAGHARASSDDADGQLLLAGSGQEGALGSTEIARLSLPKTSLVTLAACGTFRGSAERIEGMSSVARAFIAAGVPYVVGTLWDVPDQNTADLFISFHRHLHLGRSPAAALREAQIAQIRRADNPSLSWATVAVMGARTRSTEAGGNNDCRRTNHRNLSAGHERHRLRGDHARL
jgi:CHAT domain-containing protein